MRTFWYAGQLHVVNRNRLVAILLRKTERADRFWAALDKIVFFWRRSAENQR